MSIAPFLVVLGLAQDGGHPHPGCARACCAEAWTHPELRHRVSSLGLVDPDGGRFWLLDATPDLPDQLHELSTLLPGGKLAGVLLTHAHIGHYTGLMYLGREAMGTHGIPVYAMPRMRSFLAENGPWGQLVSLGNVAVTALTDGVETELAPGLSVTPMAVPHRDEYSETVGLVVRGPSHKALYLPDIDKWERWSTPVESVLAGVDRAWLDGTFYAEGEIPGRAMAEVPHPFISESMARFSALSADQRAKVHFIHLNHTNPALSPDSEASRAIVAAGMSVAREGETFGL